MTSSKGNQPNWDLTSYIPRPPGHSSNKKIIIRREKERQGRARERERQIKTEWQRKRRKLSIKHFIELHSWVELSFRKMTEVTSVDVSVFMTMWQILKGLFHCHYWVYFNGLNSNSQFNSGSICAESRFTVAMATNVRIEFEVEFENILSSADS